MSENRPILVVEDDEDGQALIAHVLEYLNIPGDVVGDAEQATQHLFHSKTTYRAAIIDLALPGRDGLQLLAEIRNNAQTANLTCIAITAFHSPRVRQEAMKAGFSAYFPKPIEPTIFAQELRAIT